jgi:L-cysteine/cystine lyase
MAQVTALDTAAVYSELPAERVAGYFNTGTIGLLPLLTHKAMTENLDAQLGDSRVSNEGYLKSRERAASLRSVLGQIVGADATEIALTRSTTEGINIAAWAQDWPAGSVAVTTNFETEGTLAPLYQLHRRRGVEVRFADATSGDPETIAEAMAAAIRPGVKLVLFSHVAYSTGAILPVKEITQLAHEAGAIVLLDAAQSVGAIPVDLHALGVDCCAFSGQKWLSGPEGTGGLFIRTEAMEQLAPTYLSDANRCRPEYPDSLVFPADASRYEQGSFSRTAICGLNASATWLVDELGLSEVHNRIRELREYCAQLVGQLSGVEMMAPPDRLAGLVVFRFRGGDPSRFVQALWSHNLPIRSMPDNGALRFSTGFFNTTSEIERAVSLLDSIA